MGDEILSSEELDALLASVEEVGAGKRKREKRIIEYDFVRPNKLSGEQLRSLQRMHEAIAQNITMILSTYLRGNIEVNIISLGELTFGGFSYSPPAPTKHARVATRNRAPASRCAAPLLGAPAKPPDRIRTLTTIEQSLL